MDLVKLPDDVRQFFTFIVTVNESSLYGETTTKDVKEKLRIHFPEFFWIQDNTSNDLTILNERGIVDYYHNDGEEFRRYFLYGNVDYSKMMLNLTNVMKGRLLEALDKNQFRTFIQLLGSTIYNYVVSDTADQIKEEMDNQETVLRTNLISNLETIFNKIKEIKRDEIVEMIESKLPEKALDTQARIAKIIDSEQDFIEFLKNQTSAFTKKELRNKVILTSNSVDFNNLFDQFLDIYFTWSGSYTNENHKIYVPKKSWEHFSKDKGESVDIAKMAKPYLYNTIKKYYGKMTLESLLDENKDEEVVKLLKAYLTWDMRNTI